MASQWPASWQGAQLEQVKSRAADRLHGQPTAPPVDSRPMRCPRSSSCISRPWARSTSAEPAEGVPGTYTADSSLPQAVQDAPPSCLRQHNKHVACASAESDSACSPPHAASVSSELSWPMVRPEATSCLRNDRASSGGQCTEDKGKTKANRAAATKQCLETETSRHKQLPRQHIACEPPADIATERRYIDGWKLLTPAS